MSVNYNSTQIGVPYVRANNITIEYPTNSLPVVTISQAMAVKLADNTIVEINPKASFSFTLNLATNALVPIPLIDPSTGEPLGASTNLQSLMVGILSVIRQQQLLVNT
jgi:hypothetical protein